MIDLKHRLAEGELSLGSWVTLGHPGIAEVVAQAGFDWLAIDMEHSTITLDSAAELIRAVQASNCVPLVRVSANDPVLIKRVMDAGAVGVIVPMVNNADDARRAVAAVKYPPEGTRGVGLARAQRYGFAFDEYVDWVVANSIVIVQIEHADAVDEIGAICAVPGVDGTIVGPYDLSGSLGYPGEFDRPEVAEALARYEAGCDGAGLAKGIHVVQPDAAAARRYIERGYALIALGVDFLFLGTLARQVVQLARGKGM